MNNSLDITLKEFCIELMRCEYPNVSNAEFISSEIKRILKEDISASEIEKYWDKKFIESEQLDREHRKIKYSLSSKDIFYEQNGYLS